MRGKHVLTDLELRSARLIPAHAGKTGRLQAASPGQTAHPRACGENATFALAVSLIVGSSPRMRGKPQQSASSTTRRGLIPAHAGKTKSARVGVPPLRAHPRACGENFHCQSRSTRYAGSSPRMRGKPFRVRPDFADERLIPAHAGKTKSARSLTGEKRAHPRACGENTERSGVLALRSVRSWKTLSFPSSLKVTHCRAFVQLPFSRIRL